MEVNNLYEIITDEELSCAIENDLSDSYFKISAQFLWDACNDWPTFNLSEPKDLIASLRLVISGKLNYKNLIQYNNSIDVRVHPFRGESVCSLI